MKKLGIIFGGKSDEHQVSILSASSVINAIDKSKYKVVQIGIGRDGSWYHILDRMDDITSLDDSRIHTLIPQNSQEQSLGNPEKISFDHLKDMIDFAFPVLHGPFGEDGTIQGLFEMLDIPYAGCGVAASALAMDKVFTKEIWIRAGLPVCRHKSIDSSVDESEREEHLKTIAEELGFPIFVKPANMGSSVGVSRATDMKELIKSVAYALNYDHRIIIEEEINGRELETAVLGNNIINVASVGEIVAKGGFYDYDSKYKDGSTELTIPANLPEDICGKIRELAKKAYMALDGKGFSRVDFFLDELNGNVFINEMNTIPGFTRYSMFPGLWNDAGLGYNELIERIIELGNERYNAKNNRQED
jgi:D-alanine-D-alanine ligase